MRMGFPLERVGFGVDDRAHGQSDRGAAAVVGGSVQIVERLDVGKCSTQRVLGLGFVKGRAGQLLFGGVEPQGTIG